MTKTRISILFSLENGKISFENKTYVVKKRYIKLIKLVCFIYSTMPFIGMGVGSLLSSDKSLQTVYRLAGMITGYLIAYIRKRILLPEELQDLIEETESKKS